MDIRVTELHLGKTYYFHFIPHVINSFTNVHFKGCGYKRKKKKFYTKQFNGLNSRQAAKFCIESRFKNSIKTCTSIYIIFTNLMTFGILYVFHGQTNKVLAT